MKNTLVQKISALSAALALTGCAISPESRDALAGVFGAISAAANTTLQAQQGEQQQLMQYQNQVMQNNADQERARQLQQLCMNPVNRQNPLCLRPQ
jgi:hypothetical protein